MHVTVGRGKKRRPDPAATHAARLALTTDINVPMLSPLPSSSPTHLREVLTSENIQWELKTPLWSRIKLVFLSLDRKPWPALHQESHLVARPWSAAKHICSGQLIVKTGRAVNAIEVHKATWCLFPARCPVDTSSVLVSPGIREISDREKEWRKRRETERRRQNKEKGKLGLRSEKERPLEEGNVDKVCKVWCSIVLL